MPEKVRSAVFPKLHYTEWYLSDFSGVTAQLTLSADMPNWVHGWAYTLKTYLLLEGLKAC